MIVSNANTTISQHYKGIAMRVLASCVLALSSCVRASYIPLGPPASIVPPGGSSTAGVTLTLAGDQDNLFAVSLNTGVWRSYRGQNGGRGPWRRHPDSPTE